MIKVSVHTEDEQGNVYTLLEDVVIIWKNKVLVVPAGFKSDGASVPRFFWRFLGHPFDRHHLRAGVRHDYRYACGVVPRKDCDRMYRNDLKADGLGFIKRNLEYIGVRVFGRSHYNGKG